jgi:hypothetical protein
VAVFELNMTMEELMAPIEQLPPGDYSFAYEGLLKDDQGGIYFPTQAGGQSVKARFRVVSPDPLQNGKGVIYQGTLGQFSFANLQKVIPLMTARGIDDEVGIGTMITASIGHTKKVINGEERTFLKWSKMKVVA